MKTPRRTIVAVIDDDELVLDALEDLVESAGHTVMAFQSGPNLLEGGRLSEIDRLITDIGMPLIDGFELRRVARSRRPELPVILITGRHDIAAQRPAAGIADRLFLKPLDGQARLAVIGGQ